MTASTLKHLEGHLSAACNNINLDIMGALLRGKYKATGALLRGKYKATAILLIVA